MIGPQSVIKESDEEEEVDFFNSSDSDNTSQKRLEVGIVLHRCDEEQTCTQS